MLRGIVVLAETFDFKNCLQCRYTLGKSTLYQKRRTWFSSDAGVRAQGVCQQWADASDPVYL